MMLLTWRAAMEHSRFVQSARQRRDHNHVFIVFRVWRGVASQSALTSCRVDGCAALQAAGASKDLLSIMLRTWSAAAAHRTVVRNCVRRDLMAVVIRTWHAATTAEALMWSCANQCIALRTAAARVGFLFAVLWAWRTVTRTWRIV